MVRKKNKNKKLKIALIGIIGLSLITATTFVINDRELKNNTIPPVADISDSPEKQQDQNTQNSINEDTNDSDNLAAKPTIKDENSVKPSSANVFISDANQYGDYVEVRSFVSNVISEGKCKIEFFNSAQTITRNVVAIPDAKSTLCTPVTVKRSEFKQGGKWLVKVTFSNDTITGSNQTEVNL